MIIWLMLLLHQRFFCGGRLIFGPDVNSLFLTSFLIGAPALTFCIRMLVWIQKDDPIFNYTVLTSAFILTLLVCILSLSFFNSLAFFFFLVRSSWPKLIILRFKLISLHRVWEFTRDFFLHGIWESLWFFYQLI